jgi:hypothetical protein
MATPKKKYKYTIFYTDGAYMTFELTREDYNDIAHALVHGKMFATVSIGTLGLKDVRSIVEQKEEEEQEQEQPQDTNPPLDQESQDWIKHQIGGF